MRTLIARRLLLRHVLDPDERYVGVLIPPSAGALVSNAAVTLAGRVAVNLNYTVSNDVMNACIRRAGIRHVLTSRKVMEKFDFHFDAEVVYLDELRAAGMALMFSTQSVDEAVRRGDRLLVLAGGRRLFAGTAAEMVAAHGGGDGGAEAAELAFMRLVSGVGEGDAR